MDELKEQICEILFKRSEYTRISEINGLHQLHERQFDNVSEDILSLLEQRLQAGRHETIVTGMTGEVVKMGTMLVDDEQLTGVFVICDPDEFTKQTTNILYRNVKIVPFDECQ